MNDRRDQKSRDDEEYIHPQEAAFEEVWIEMEANHRNDGDGS
jgi:hypothetical protein